MNSCLSNPAGRLDYDADSDLLRCHVCGRRYRFLAQHARLAHGLTADDYRGLAGLNRQTRLMAAGMRARIRENTAPLIARLREEGKLKNWAEDRDKWARDKQAAVEVIREGLRTEGRDARRASWDADRREQMRESRRSRNLAVQDRAAPERIAMGLRRYYAEHPEAIDHDRLRRMAEASRPARTSPTARASTTRAPSSPKPRSGIFAHACRPANPHPASHSSTVCRLPPSTPSPTALPGSTSTEPSTTHGLPHIAAATSRPLPDRDRAIARSSSRDVGPLAGVVEKAMCCDGAVAMARLPRRQPRATGHQSRQEEGWAGRTGVNRPSAAGQIATAPPARDDKRDVVTCAMGCAVPPRAVARHTARANANALRGIMALTRSRASRETRHASSAVCDP